MANPVVEQRVEFDPCAAPREDLQSYTMASWAARTGSLPVSQRDQMPDSSWKNRPDRDWSVLESHWVKAFPYTPRDHLAECECRALRNARELAKQ